MKKYLVLLIAVGLCGSFLFTCLAGDLKIGYVDIFEVFNEYDKTKDYDKKLEKKKEKVEKDLNVKKEAIKKLQNKLSVVKKEDREKEEEKLNKEIQGYREAERKAMTDIKKERDKKMKNIIEDINKIIRDYAKKNGFSLIVNENAVLYGEKVMDITSEVLRISNQKYKK